jgi:serine O-acetyltransferase
VFNEIRGHKAFFMSKFAADIARYRSRGCRGKDLWLDAAVWSIACYRLGNWLHVTRPFVLIRIPLKVVSFVANKFCEVFMEMCIDPHASIGPGLYIGHIGGVHINPQAILGSNCDLAHRVTIGASAMGRQGAPVLGDDVYIGTGATLVGKIKVGNGAKIAANTLVITNIPDGATVMGVPGRIIMRPPKTVQPQAAMAAAEITDAG